MVWLCIHRKYYGGRILMTIRFFVLLACLIVLPWSPGALAQGGKDAPGKLRYVVFHAPPFMIYSEGAEGEASGIDVEIVREIARRLGLDVELVACPWLRCLSLMEQGEADILSSAYKKPEREVFMRYFAAPFLDSLPIAFYFCREDGRAVDRYEDLYALSSVGVLKGASYFPRFDADKAIRKYEVVSQDQLFPMLAAGRIQAVAGYVPTENFRLIAEGYKGRIVRSAYVFEEEALVYMAMSRRSPLAGRFEEFDAVNEALIREGFIKAVVEKYYSRFEPGEAATGGK
jgi:polar amino acid transport system substrate-binding protein